VINNPFGKAVAPVSRADAVVVAPMTTAESIVTTSFEVAFQPAATASVLIFLSLALAEYTRLNEEVPFLKRVSAGVGMIRSR
jgi:hypothetical protein